MICVVLCSAFVFKEVLKETLGCLAASALLNPLPNSILISFSSDFSLASRIPYPGSLADPVGAAPTGDILLCNSLGRGYRDTQFPSVLSCALRISWEHQQLHGVNIKKKLAVQHEKQVRSNSSIIVK